MGNGALTSFETEHSAGPAGFELTQISVKAGPSSGDLQYVGQLKDWQGVVGWGRTLKWGPQAAVAEQSEEGLMRPYGCGGWGLVC